MELKPVFAGSEPLGWWFFKKQIVKFLVFTNKRNYCIIMLNRFLRLAIVTVLLYLSKIAEVSLAIIDAGHRQETEKHENNSS